MLVFQKLQDGGANWCNFSQSELFKTVLFGNSSKFILVHNHPSGNAKPSESDYEMTRKVLEVARLLDLQFLDHIVIGDNQYTSIMSEMQ